jgi:hypothetical protein
MSLGCRMRCAIRASKSLPMMFAARLPSVPTTPGSIAFTRILLGPNSSASTRVINVRAAASRRSAAQIGVEGLAAVATSTTAATTLAGLSFNRLDGIAATSRGRIYEVPVHADIPHQEVVFLNEVDPISSPTKAKGVGELGLDGVSAAAANAIHNATGVRARDYLVTLDMLIERLPQPA